MPEDDTTPTTSGGSPAPEAKDTKADPSVLHAVHLTPDNPAVKAIVESALAAERKAAEDKAKAEREEAERVAAEQKGEWEKLAKQNEQRAKELDEHNRKLRRAIVVSEALAEHPDYAKDRRKFVESYVNSSVADTLEGEKLTKAIRDAIAEYVTANPIQPAKPAVAGAPAPRASGARIPPTRLPQGEVRPRRWSTVSSNI